MLLYLSWDCPSSLSSRCEKYEGRPLCFKPLKYRQSTWGLISLLRFGHHHVCSFFNPSPAMKMDLAVGILLFSSLGQLELCRIWLEGAGTLPTQFRMILGYRTGCHGGPSMAVVWPVT